MEKINKFLELLNLVDVVANEDLVKGRFENITINKKNLTAEILLRFPKVLDINTFEELDKKISNYFIKTMQFKYARIKMIYDDESIDDDILKKYYEYTVTNLENERSRFSILHSFHHEISKNIITIYVANQDEINIIKELVQTIHKNLSYYDIKTTINVEQSSFETPIAKIIEENNKQTTIETLKMQEQYEKSLSSNNPLEKEKINEPKPIKKPKLKSNMSRMATPLKMIPADEAGMRDYRQQHGTNDFLIVGDIVSCEIIDRESKSTGTIRKFRIYEAVVTDGDDSIMIKTFINLSNPDEIRFYEEEARVGKRIRAYGYADYDTFARDVVMKISEMWVEGDSIEKEYLDLAPQKRVELHAHTKMTAQDSVMDVEDYVKQAIKYGHKALAITDMYNVHAFPDFYDATKNLNITPIMGVEGLLVDDEKFKLAFDVDSDCKIDLSIPLMQQTFVVYDLETTGLSSKYNEIIEIGAVKVRGGEIIDDFNPYIKPKKPISDFISNLTTITNDDVRDAEPIEKVMPKFKEWIKGCILVAHNAAFDNSYLYENMRKLGLYEGLIPTVDTMRIAMARYSGSKLKAFSLKAVTKYFDVEIGLQHRAVNDAKATALVFIKMLNDMIDSNIFTYNDINKCLRKEDIYRVDNHPKHFTILVKDQIGKKNLYKIISDSHTNHFHREPRILKSYLEKHREGLLIGSGCMKGDVFTTAYEKNYEELKKVMSFYDYIEVQPPSHYEVLVQESKDLSIRDNVKDSIKTIIKAAKELNKLVVATGDVHHLFKEDLPLREIYIGVPKLGGGIHSLASIKEVPSTHYMSTQEMLDEFKFLGKELSTEIVITNTNLIADQITRFPLFPKELFAPKDDMLKDRGVPSFKQAVIDMTYANAKSQYGDNLPKYIENRLEKELNSIIGNNFASIYYISHLLVKHSTDAGYIVGSRGSVGSSLVATFMKITEVNALPPHYYCSKCHFVAIKYSDEEKKIYERSQAEISLDERLQKADTGYDLEPTRCPICGEILCQNGVDIPFETFLGFKGDKVPDIDLNFSGEYQAKAHEFCRELFGVNHAFRAGTISTIADKTAYEFILKYFNKKERLVRRAEVNRLVKKIAGVKRSTGQHPGGIVVLPKEVEYTDLIPVQYPADDIEAIWRTTHFDYHKFESNLLKLDILGHDDPTMIRHLMDFVDKYPDEFPFSKVEDIPLSDRDVFALFNSLDSLKVTSEQVNGEIIGTTGIPEFGTSLAKDMLSEIKPKTVADLLKISGLSHGKGVWNGNSRDFMNGTIEGFPSIAFKELIGCRDDIMIYLISKNLPASDAFKIMESVRKGRGLSKDFEKEMLSYNVPKWYIESCKLIQYMFPKAHATAYVIMALRIGWFKVHRPIYYYSGYFSNRAEAFDALAMASGHEAIKLRLKELDNKIKLKVATPKEIDTEYSLLLALEMTARGYNFVQIDIFNSEATTFKVLEDKMSLLIPFSALDSLGESIAISIVNARNEKMFTSKKDVLTRTKLNSTQYEKLDEMGAFKDLPDDDQIGLGLFKQTQIKLK